MFAFSPAAFSVQAFSPAAFAIDTGTEPPAVPPAPTFGVGGGRTYGEERTRLYREHHDYLDGLREIQVQIADDIRGVRTIAMRSDMTIPDAVLPPPMRGTVPPTRVADVLGDPLILAAMALLIDEADD